MQMPPSAALSALSRLDLSRTGEVWQALPGGRSNSVWRAGDFVIKHHRAAAASPLFPNDPLAEATALSLLSPLGLAPRLRASGDDWIIYDHADGTPWRGDPAPLARMLHRLHITDLPATTFRPLPNGSAAVLAHAATFAPPDLPPPPPDPGLAPVPPRPVHGDAVLGNILATPRGPLLIDWQCPGMGDPTEDLVTLASPAMMWLYTGQIARDGWADALFDAYPCAATAARARALRPVYQWRIAAHCAWKAARGDADYARALPMELAAL
jgi:thiamine kinase